MGKGKQKRDDKARAQANAAERKRVVLRVYQGCETAASAKLAELAATGVVPSCSAGCSHCCSLEVPVSRPEADALVDWLVANRTAAELDAIRERLRGWLDWYRGEHVRLVAGGMDRVDVFFRHGPACALLEDRRCSVYPVRPVTCRNHFVSSPVATCDPAVGTGEPDVMLAVASATYDHVAEIRRIVEAHGGNYMASVHLLPEWLAHLLGVELEPWRPASAS